MITEDEPGFGGHGPVLAEIQCTNCKHKNHFEWKGKQIPAPGLDSCAKYKSKPEGVLFPLKKDNHDRIGEYKPCPCFESEDN